MHTTILRIAQVRTRVGLGTTRIYQLVGDGIFPAPVRLGGRAVGWVESEVEDWLQHRVATGRVTIRTRTPPPPTKKAEPAQRAANAA